MKLTAREISQACGGDWSPQAPTSDIESVSTDTRQLAPGSLFVALKGENFDAHDYLDKAAKAGAGALVLRQDAPFEGDVPVLRVDDTLRALGDIAAAWRAKCPARRVAIVGSSGKTTTKEMLAAILRDAGHAHASAGNFNNLIGLPLTLFELDTQAEWAVLELGMNEPGELTRLTEIAEPDLLVFLNVGTAHIGQFDSPQALLEAKAEAARALRPDVPILYDAASDRTRQIMRQWANGRPLISFAVDAQADIQATDTQPTPPQGYRFTLNLAGEELSINLPLFGRYNVANAVAAAAAAHALGVASATIARSLSAVQPAHMRSELRQIALENGGHATLVVDCYNANPDSMRAALESLGEWAAPEKSRLFLVLGDMLELGDESPAQHRAMARWAEALPRQELLLIGEETRQTLEACGEKKRARWFETHETLAARLREQLRPDDIVFLKGSRGARLEHVIENLQSASEQPSQARKA